ncbi:predicted protein [Botrytis cinerea T4]|uniref:Uncharacterized protein n=1 Tax=Botryotinia fuckeliana (strain T4) TaxID=999810 RepID=G2Y1V3_BOTF4|nr:predicted protein [Botrytis cinerea T4]
MYMRSSKHIAGTGRSCLTSKLERVSISPPAAEAFQLAKPVFVGPLN